ncbi:pali-domain-containing protein [Venturia nashicola]|nr:pali-domain-containing protein [Venturia nashicola]
MSIALPHTFNTVGRKTANGLTGSFILHPIASSPTFIAALIAVGGFFGSVIGLILGILAWIMTVVVMVIDFATFGGIKNHIDEDRSGSSAKYSVGMWTTLASWNHHCFLHLLHGQKEEVERTDCYPQ